MPSNTDLSAMYGKQGGKKTFEDFVGVFLNRFLHGSVGLNVERTFPRFSFPEISLISIAAAAVLLVLPELPVQPVLPLLPVLLERSRCLLSLHL